MERKAETRPWGNFLQFTHNTPSTVKIITLNPDSELSLQYHEKRTEFWKILSGNPTVIINNTTHDAREGDEFTIPAKTKHQIKSGENPIRILEIATGDFDEQDIVRLEDKYGRI